MLRLLRSLALAAAAWLTAANLAFAAGADPPGAPSDPGRQVLVLLKTPPPHLGPGADYGSAYGEGPARIAQRRIASRLARRHGLTMASDWPLPLLGLDCFVMTAPPGMSAKAAAAALSAEPAVAWAEPMSLYRAQAAPPPSQARLYLAEPAAREWSLAALQRIATGRGVRVAVIDSAVERDHPDLAGQVAIQKDFVTDRPASSEEHGTAVAGVIAAKGLGVAGIAPGARLLALRACWQVPSKDPDAPATYCDSLSLAKALHYAISARAQVINMSLAGPPDPLLGRLIDLARSRGAVVVGAYDPALAGGGFPANHDGVVAVADETARGLPRGVLGAPGRDVPTTEPGGRWYLVSGNSFAAAHVSGLLALIKQRAPQAHGAAALATTTPHGRTIDACASLLKASAPCDCSCPHPGQEAAVARR
ncbi:MAG TPA: S8 family serine peptidase [Caulobacteraceae bacterium]|nr:S8 family serine peptidase [Caulobacteraceae bacterium]